MDQNTLTGLIDGFVSAISPGYAVTKSLVNRQPDAGAWQTVTSAATSAPGNSELSGAVGWVGQHVPAAQFLLDLPSRAVDTVALVGQQGDRVANQGGNGFAELLNKDSWGKAWDNWGQPNHVSAGTLWGNMIRNDLGGIDQGIRYGDPFDAQQAQAMQASAKDTWYGDIMGGAIDLSAGFLGVPGGGSLKAARAAKVADAANVERMAALAGTEGALASVKATKVQDALSVRRGGTASAESQLAQLRDAVTKTNDISRYPDQNAMMNYLSPWMQGATESAKANMSDLFTLANRLPEASRTHAKVNAMLAAMGSGAARQEMISTFPLMAAHMENVTSAPGALSTLADLMEARSTTGSTEFNVNSVLERTFGTAKAKAELDGLRTELQNAMADTQASVDYLNKVVEQKPPNRNARWHQDKKDWVAEHSAAKATVADSRKTQAWLNAEMDAAKATYNDARARLAAARPGVGPMNDVLTKMASLGEDGAWVGPAAPTRLDAIKSAYRQAVGDHYLYSVSDGLPNVYLRMLPTPRGALASVGTRRARGGITLAEPDVARLELMESLKRSGQFSADEIRKAGNDLISTPQDRRGQFVQQVQQDMLTRISMSHGKTLEQATEDVASGIRGYDQGRQYLSQALDEATAKGHSLAMVRGDNSELHAWNTAHLKAHLQDTAPFIDPTVFDHALRELDSGVLPFARKVVRYGSELNSIGQNMWKHAVLLRPGLGVRAMLDTELRSMAMIGAATAFADAINASRKLGVKGARGAAAKAGLKFEGLDGVATEALGMDAFKVDIGAGQTADFVAHGDAATFAANRLAASKGTSVHGALVGSTNRALQRLQFDRSKWQMYQASNIRWPQAYSQHAGTLLASPTVRKMLDSRMQEVVTGPNGVFTGGAGVFDNYVNELFQTPAIAREYEKLALPQGISKADYVATVMHEVDLMFPTKQVAEDLLSGRLSKGGKPAQAWVEKNFPAGDRFNIPAPESILNKDSVANLGRRAVGKFYASMLDAPDFWMARNPVFVHKFQDTVKAEAKSLLAKRVAEQGPDAMLTKSDLRMLDARARTSAMTQVRNTFFDTTRYTSAHHYLSGIAPFFAPWEDAMVSWSRLLYDDPNRIFRLAGAWNAPANLSQWMPDPIFVDGNGAPLGRGQDSASGRYIVLPLKGRGGLQDVRINQQALNSIAQGEVAWLPGFGPTAQIATTTLLGNWAKLDKGAVLDIIGTDNWLGQNLLKSMYLDGQLPQSGWESQVKSVLPASLRNLANDTLGDNFAANVSYQVNKAYIESQKSGTPFNQDQAMADAVTAARTAGLVRLVQQGVIGLSGRATVEGQFYVDQMHQIDSLTPDQLKAQGYSTPEEMFADLFPEASLLDWRLSRNETGVAATVNAEKSAFVNKATIEKYPEMGWFIVGTDNVGGEFSRTAYNMQLDEKYGLAQKGRVRETPEQTVRGAIVSQGWDQYSKFKLQLAEAMKTTPLTSSQQSKVKAAFVEWLAGRNREWFVEYNDRKNKSAQFLSDADAIAGSKAMADRPDMQAYATYSQIRDQVMRSAGLSSLTGTSKNAAFARSYLSSVGERLASQNLGFSQAWDRMLSGEVDPLPSDSKYVGGS